MTRTKTTLINTFEDIKKLQQYLYASSTNYVDIETELGTKIRIRMDENLEYHALCLNVPHSIEICFSDMMTNQYMSDIIEQLKNSSSETNANISKWQEILLFVNVATMDSRKTETNKKDTECNLYIHTYKCPEKSCKGCQERYKTSC